MRELLVRALAFVAAMAMASSWAGNSPTDEATRVPGAPIPTYLLTESFAGETVYVESGDRLEVRLPEAGEADRWRRMDTTDIEVIGPAYGVLERHDGRLQRVFRYLTRQVGRIELVFRLVDPGSTEVQPEPLSFVIMVR